MKVTKSIEILKDILIFRNLSPTFDEPDAIKLGIQALKLLSNDRINPGVYALLPLPGETPEDE